MQMSKAHRACDARLVDINAQLDNMGYRARDRPPGMPRPSWAQDRKGATAEPQLPPAFPASGLQSPPTDPRASSVTRRRLRAMTVAEKAAACTMAPSWRASDRVAELGEQAARDLLFNFSKAPSPAGPPKAPHNPGPCSTVAQATYRCGPSGIEASPTSGAPLATGIAHANLADNATASVGAVAAPPALGVHATVQGPTLVDHPWTSGASVARHQGMSVRLISPLCMGLSRRPRPGRLTLWHPLVLPGRQGSRGPEDRWRELLCSLRPPWLPLWEGTRVRLTPRPTPLWPTRPRRSLPPIRTQRAPMRSAGLPPPTPT